MTPDSSLLSEALSAVALLALLAIPALLASRNEVRDWWRQLKRELS